MNLKINKNKNEQNNESDNINADKKIMDEIRKQHDFYTVKINKDGKFESIYIDKTKLIQKFLKLGFCRFDITEDRYVMVEVKENTIRRVSATIIRDTFFDWLKTLKTCDHIKRHNGDEVIVCVTSNMLIEKFLNAIEKYFAPLLFERVVNPKKISIQKDSKENKFFYFQNGFIDINKSGCTFYNYSKLKNHVWQTSILANTFEYTEKVGNYEKFIYNICGKVQERKESLMSIFGYMLHAFYDYKTFLILFTDACLSENGEPNGRTGKTLTLKGCGKMLNASEDETGYVDIDGKTFKGNDEKKYQRADIDTSLIHINDIINWFNIESLFIDITDGITVRQMWEKPFTIHAKLAMSSNKSVKIDGASARDRVIVFEFSDHYNEYNNPETEFNQWFFRDWNDQNNEWNMFYSFMVRCCITFFNKGIIRAKEINYSERTIREHTNKDFLTWFKFYWVSIQKEMINTKKDVVKSKRMLYASFVTEYDDFSRDKSFKQSKLTKWISYMLKYKKIEYLENRGTEDQFIFKYKPEHEIIPDEFNNSMELKEQPKEYKQARADFTTPTKQTLQEDKPEFNTDNDTFNENDQPF